MNNPYPSTHPAHAFQQTITDRIHDKVLLQRTDGSKVIIYRDVDGNHLRAKEPSQKELDTMEIGVPSVRPDRTVAVRKRTRRTR